MSPSTFFCSMVVDKMIACVLLLHVLLEQVAPNRGGFIGWTGWAMVHPKILAQHVPYEHMGQRNAKRAQQALPIAHSLLPAHTGTCTAAAFFKKNAQLATKCSWLPPPDSLQVSTRLLAASPQIPQPDLSFLELCCPQSALSSSKFLIDRIYKCSVCYVYIDRSMFWINGIIVYFFRTLIVSLYIQKIQPGFYLGPAI